MHYRELRCRGGRRASFVHTALVLLLLTIPLRASEVPRPNILFLLIDDMGWGDLSCFGNREAKTPHIDRMAAEGLRFTQFYVASPICSPSRCAFVTGQYPQRWRIHSYLNNRADNNRRGVAQWLEPRAPTLARTLQTVGYATGHFGKWHLGGQRDVVGAPAISEYGYDASLTNFEGMGPKLLPLVRKPGDVHPQKIWADAERLGGPVTWMNRSEITGGYVNAALRFMEEALIQKKPFYIDLWPDDVHSPYSPSPDRWSPEKRAAYHSVLEEMDTQVGRILDRIRTDPGLRDNTMVLICSDNGPEAGAGSAGPFRGRKTEILEGGIRSPLVVWGPGLIEKSRAGTEDISTVLAGMDFAPSLARIAGTKFADEADGLDVSSALLGRGPVPRAGALFWRRPPDRRTPFADLAVREGDWKLLCEYDGSRPQLFDLAKDPGESTNLAAGNPVVVDRLRSAVLAWHQALPADNGPTLGEKAPGDGARRKE